MKKITPIEEAIKSMGISKFTEAMSSVAGEDFSMQQINHWRSRGVPYKWHDAMKEVSGLSKDQMRNAQNG